MSSSIAEERAPATLNAEKPTNIPAAAQHLQRLPRFKQHLCNRANNILSRFSKSRLFYSYRNDSVIDVLAAIEEG